jgi:hypothetical protein
MSTITATVYSYSWADYETSIKKTSCQYVKTFVDGSEEEKAALESLKKCSTDTIVAPWDTSSVSTTPLSLDGRVPEIMLLNQKAENMLTQYVNGKVSDEEISQLFSECYETLKQTNEFYGRTSGTPEDNQKIAESVSLWFMRHGSWDAIGKMNQTGIAIADQYGSHDDQDWFYYDSKYYYMTEHLKDIYTEKLTELSKTEKFTVPNLTKLSRDTCLVDFNEYFEFSMLQGSRNGKMIDLTLPPPENFTMFLKELQYSRFDTKTGEYIDLQALNPFTQQTSSVSVNVPKSRLEWLLNLEVNEKNIFDYLDIDQTKKTMRQTFSLDSLINSKNKKTFESDFNKTIEEDFSNVTSLMDGILIVGDETGEYKFNVPFHKQGTYEHFNAGEFYSNSYLSNFEIFTGSYGHATYYKTC